MPAKMTFRRFLAASRNGGGVDSGGYYLRARDAFAMYTYIYDVVRFRKGGVWSLWKAMPTLTLEEQRAVWLEANPQMAAMGHPFAVAPIDDVREMVRQLGFQLDSSDRVLLPN